MLLKLDHIDRIFAGEVTVVFRRFVRPTVKTGGTLRTRRGLLAVTSVERATRTRLKKADATAAGFPSLRALLDDIDGQRDAPLYRVEVSPGGTDPRLALRKKKPGKAETRELAARLTRWDEQSALGPWAWPSLVWIGRHEGRRAGDLADELGYEKKWLKANIRRMKALGLTESLEVGYRLSPRGREVVKLAP